jgi:hypothetical protein
MRALWSRVPGVRRLAGVRPALAREQLDRMIDKQHHRAPEPMDPEEIFLTDLIVHSNGCVQVKHYAETGEAEAFGAWLRDAEQDGLVRRPDLGTVCVTDAGRRRFDEINQPVTVETTHPNGLRSRLTFRRAR